MKKYLLLIILTLSASLNLAQTVFVEDFNYNAGDLLTAKGWKNSSGTSNFLTVVSPGLTLTGYPAAGNSVELKTTGEDAYQSFTSVNSGNLYFSFLMNVQSAQTGDYFIAVSPSASQTNYYARTHLKTSGAGYVIGLSKSNELSGGYIYGTKVLNYNTTYAVVVKHTFTGTAADSLNDPENVYVFSGSFPSTEPATPEIANYVQTGKSDPKDLGYITLRQGSTTAAPALKLDGLRVAKSWTTLTDVEKNNTTIPTEYALSQNYPNPFNPSTVISYQLPEAGNVTLKVYDVLGNEVAALVNEFQQAGTHKAKFANTQLTSGIYFYKLQAGTFTATKKMMLVK